jgi:microcystin-dependent protein
MALETADFINELDANNPAFNDPVGRGDDHLRLVKHVLKTSFPAFTGDVTLSDAEINALPQDIIDAVADTVAELSPHLVPTGAITLWSGSNASIPTGWQLCNGTNGTPDLRNRFIVGSGADYATGNNGGADTKTTSAGGNHNHGGATASHALTIAQMPSHDHPFRLTRRVTGDDATGGTVDAQILTADRNRVNQNVNITGADVQNTGSGQSHSHGISNSGTHTHTVDVRPRYYALAYIIKLSTFP